MFRVRPALIVACAAMLGAVPAAASHPADFAKAVRPFFQSGNLGPAEKLFLSAARIPGRNQLLYLYEMANLYQMKGDVDQSLELFADADRVAHDQEGKAVVSAGGVASQTGAVLTNDTLLPWEGDCPDKVMSRTLDAMNYLAKQDLEGARVEVRKAEEYQVRERQKRQKEVTKASALSEAATAKYGRMFSYVQDVRNSYENAFTYYLSSLIYGAQGPAGLDDALVDIKRAYELAPQAPAVREAYLDFASRAGDTDDLEALRTRWGTDSGAPLPDRAHAGTVAVIFEAGFVPPLSEVSIDVFAVDKLFSMAFPIYNDFGEPQPPLRISAPGAAWTTSLVVDLRRLMIKSLQERMPAILARGTAGAIAKVQAQKKMENSFGGIGQLLGAIATKAVTFADLRSWLSLPAEIQAAQFTLPPGPNDLALSGSGWSEHLALDVAPDSRTFVLVRAAPGFRSIKAVSLKPEA